MQAYKCVFIGLMCGSHEVPPRERESRLPLWTPDLPANPLAAQQALAWNGLRDANPPYYLDICFGGDGGEKLALLNRVVLYQTNSSALQGIAFSYDDDTEMVFGTGHATAQPGFEVVCTEPSFYIRGAAGERITRVDFTVDVFRIITGLEVSRRVPSDRLNLCCGPIIRT
jgi:hypothetical protein